MPAYPGVDIATVNVNTDILTNAGASDLVVTVNILNRNAEAAAIKLHVVTAGGAAGTANAIEWGRQIAGGGVFERYQIPLGPGQKLVAQSTKANVNFVCWGMA